MARLLLQLLHVLMLLKMLLHRRVLMLQRHFVLLLLLGDKSILDGYELFDGLDKVTVAALEDELKDVAFLLGKDSLQHLDAV